METIYVEMMGSQGNEDAAVKTEKLLTPHRKAAILTLKSTLKE